MHCDNLPVINTINGTYQDNQLKEKNWQNTIERLTWYYKTEKFSIQHISGKLNPADLLTKTLGLTKMRESLEETALKNVFSLEFSKSIKEKVDKESREKRKNDNKADILHSPRRCFKWFQFIS